MYDEYSIELFFYIYIQVWDILIGDELCLFLFMVVLIIYSKLIEYYGKENLMKEEKEKIRFRCE